jgi:hypothetical protein
MICMVYVTDALIKILLLLHLRITLSGPFPFRINYEIMNLIDNR